MLRTGCCHLGFFCNQKWHKRVELSLLNAKQKIFRQPKCFTVYFYQLKTVWWLKLSDNITESIQTWQLVATCQSKGSPTLNQTLLFRLFYSILDLILQSIIMFWRRRKLIETIHFLENGLWGNKNRRLLVKSMVLFTYYCNQEADNACVIFVVLNWILILLCVCLCLQMALWSGECWPTPPLGEPSWWAVVFRCFSSFRESTRSCEWENIPQ